MAPYKPSLYVLPILLTHLCALLHELIPSLQVDTVDESGTMHLATVSRDEVRVWESKSKSSGRW